MKIKLSTILTAVSLVGVAVTGVLSARAGKKAGKIERDLEETRLDEVGPIEKAQATWKCYIPAVAAGIVTIGCGAYAKRLDTKEIIKLTGALGVATANFDKLKKSFYQYRAGVINEVGEEKEEKIRQSIAKRTVIDAATGIEEGSYTFHIDWLGEDLYFDSTLSKVLTAMDNVNKTLNDYNQPDWPCPCVGQFLEDVGHPELVNETALKAGWHIDELSTECGVTWLNWSLVPKCDDHQQVYYDIWVDWLPWEDIMGVIQKLEDEGII